MISLFLSILYQAFYLQSFKNMKMVTALISHLMVFSNRTDFYEFYVSLSVKHRKKYISATISALGLFLTLISRNECLILLIKHRKWFKIKKKNKLLIFCFSYTMYTDDIADNEFYTIPLQWQIIIISIVLKSLLKRNSYM